MTRCDEKGNKKRAFSFHFFYFLSHVSGFSSAVMNGPSHERANPPSLEVVSLSLVVLQLATMFARSTEFNPHSPSDHCSVHVARAIGWIGLQRTPSHFQSPTSQTDPKLNSSAETIHCHLQTRQAMGQSYSATVPLRHHLHVADPTAGPTKGHDRNNLKRS